MARYKFQGRAIGTLGNIKTSLNINVYVSGTSQKQDAIVYSNVASLSSKPQITSDEYGLFEFWIDDNDYAAIKTNTTNTTKFDLTTTGDIRLSFKKADGTWTESIKTNTGPICSTTWQHIEEKS